MLCHFWFGLVLGARIPCIFHFLLKVGLIVPLRRIFMDEFLDYELHDNFMSSLLREMDRWRHHFNGKYISDYQTSWALMCVCIEVKGSFEKKKPPATSSAPFLPQATNIFVNETRMSILSLIFLIFSLNQLKPLRIIF